MILYEAKGTIAMILLVIFVASQVLIVSSILLIPKPAQALFGVGDITFNTTIVDIPKYVEKIVLGILREVALRIADKFIRRFTDKLVDKYKIRNFFSI